jgi:hypothetical protein
MATIDFPDGWHNIVSTSCSMSTSFPYPKEYFKSYEPIQLDENWGKLRQEFDDFVDRAKNKKLKIRGVEIMYLYDVWMIYAEDRKEPVVDNAIIEHKQVIAKDEDDAKVKSGVMQLVEKHWDSDYLSFIVNEIGEVKVKEKPKEVKNI